MRSDALNELPWFPKIIILGTLMFLAAGGVLRAFTDINIVTFDETITILILIIILLIIIILRGDEE